jgi:hypothetical protein
MQALAHRGVAVAHTHTAPRQSARSALRRRRLRRAAAARGAPHPPNPLDIELDARAMARRPDEEKPLVRPAQAQRKKVVYMKPPPLHSCALKPPPLKRIALNGWLGRCAGGG